MPRLRLIPFTALVLMLVGCLKAAPEAPEANAPAKITVAPELFAAPAERVQVAPMPRRGGPRLAVAPLPHEPGERDLTNEDVGLETKIEAALPELNVERLEDLKPPGPSDLTAPAAIAPLPIGVPGAPMGAGFREDPPAKVPTNPFAGRTGATKKKLVKQYGGNEESEKAVGLGLAWLAKQQKKDGGWEFDQGSHKAERAAATGLVLLAFYGAGETHKDVKGKHQKTVKDGLSWLTKNVTPNGANAGRISTNSYTQGIATIALVEAYGTTKDPALKPTAQVAVNYLQKAQGPNGSWGYSAGANGDTSICGWQLQALFAAKQAGLAVDEKVLKKAVAFLDLAGAGKEKAVYGYTDSAGAAPGTALTAIGLLSRAHIDNWSAEHPGMTTGVMGLAKNAPVGKGGVRNLYYYYYATQVLRLSGGEEWATWNEGPKDAEGVRKGGLRDWLVGQQINKDGANLGSWDPEAGWFGTECGRLGTTAVCLLNLEVYYRYVPSEKKDDKKKK